MKRYFILLVFVVLEITMACAQDLTAAVTSKANQQAAESVLNKPGAGLDRSVWSGYFSGLLNMFGTDGKSSLQFNTTPFALIHFRQYAKGDSLVGGDIFRKQAFFRSLQINGGLTPDSKQQIQVDAFSYGLKYALLNNKALNKKEIAYYNAALKAYLKNVWQPFNDVIEKYAFRHPEDAGKIIAFKQAGSKLPINLLPKKLLDTLMLDRHIKSMDSLQNYFSADAYFKILTADLKTRTSLTFSGNSSYDELKSQVSIYVFSGSLIFYGSRKDTTRQYTVTGNYTLGADTILKHSGLVRKIAELDFGPNFSFKKVTWLELKTSIDLVNTLGPLYSKENKNTGNLSVTPRIKVNKNFWLPLTFKYDAFQKNAHVSGQFSVQYSLK